MQRWVCDLARHVMQMLRHEHGCTMWDMALARDDLTPDTLAVVASHICAEKSDVRKLIQHHSALISYLKHGKILPGQRLVNEAEEVRKNYLDLQEIMKQY